MTDVVLVNLQPVTHAPPVQKEHLGLASLAAYLAARGDSVEVVDSAIHGRDGAELLDWIQARSPRVVGFSPFLTNAEQVLEAVEALAARRAGPHLTLGGHHATFYCRDILAHHPAVDSVVLGEGEEPLAELLDHLAAGSDWRGIRNLASRDGEGIRVNPCRPLVWDLDRLPPPLRAPWEVVYRDTRIAAMVTSRGCYARCGFCSIRSFYELAEGPAWRPRSARSVVDEMEGLARDHGVERIVVLDDNFLGPGQAGRRRAREIAAEILARGLRLHWTMACRANDVDEDVLRALVPAGLVRADLGIESWVPRQLAFYGKDLTVKQNERAIGILDRLGLAYRLYLIPVDPHVTLDELLVNVKNMRRVGVAHLPHPLFNRLVCFRGTSLAEAIDADPALAPASPGRPHLAGQAYRFADPRTRAAWPHLQRLDAGLRRTIEALRPRLLEAGDRPAEAAFLGRLLEMVNGFALDLAERVLLSHVVGRSARAGQLLSRGLADLSGAAEDAERAAASGAFERFESVSIGLGREEVDYPPPPLRRLGESLLALLDGEAAGEPP